MVFKFYGDFRRFLPLAALVTLLGLNWEAQAQSTATPATAATTVSAKRPNIMVLVADDWGFSDVGAFGGEIATPNIDALAKQGMRFSNFHTAGSCSPTRAMLLTGVDHHKAGVGNLLETLPDEHRGKPGYEGTLNDRVVTVSTLLQDSGYRTAIAGKWNVGSEARNLPNARGFERSIVQGDTGSDNWNPAQRYLPHHDKVYWFENGKEATMPKSFYSTEFFVDKTIEYLKAGEKDNKPFFAYVGFQANHVPLQAPASFIAKYKGVYDQGWTALRQARRDKAISLGLVPPGTPMVTMKTTADWAGLSATDKAYQARRMEVYAAMADAMDFHVGRLVAHLKNTGEFDNTVFVFLSDNGAEASDYYATVNGRLWLDWEYKSDIDHMGGPGAYAILGPGWASAASSPLNTYKFYAGEGGIREPLIIAGLPGMPQNQIYHSLTHVTDIVPTLLDMAQVPHPQGSYKGRALEPLSGRSLLPVLMGTTAPVHDAQQAIGYELSGNQVVFKGDLKLVKNVLPVGDNQWHLFDIRKDPGETADLQAALPQDFKTLQADYAAWAIRHQVLPLPEAYNPSRQVAENTLRNYFFPYYGPRFAAVLLLVAAAWVGWRRRQRRMALLAASRS